MQFLHVPSEAPDEITLYLPANRVLISAEVDQGPTLPNIHSLRGTKFRDPVQWVESLDKLRAYQAEYMVPLHGRPVSGQDKVEEVLCMRVPSHNSAKKRDFRPTLRLSRCCGNLTGFEWC